MTTLTSDDLAAAIGLFEDENVRLRREKTRLGDALRPEHRASYERHIVANAARIDRLHGALRDVLARELGSAAAA